MHHSFIISKSAFKAACSPIRPIIMDKKCLSLILFRPDIDVGRRQKLSATPDLSGTVLPLCLIPNSALKSAPPFKSVVPKA
ncbi:hypothetical protein, partial [Pseudomonas aeruginosa]|uniref:hypothetical protein n=1 Tax=Pseudomonas aeruginosa TaxID=287 RepID=UPI001C529F1A